jgi:hypothetical protein
LIVNSEPSKPLFLFLLVFMILGNIPFKYRFHPPPFAHKTRRYWKSFVEKHLRWYTGRLESALYPHSGLPIEFQWTSCNPPFYDLIVGNINMYLHVNDAASAVRSPILAEYMIIVTKTKPTITPGIVLQQYSERRNTIEHEYDLLNKRSIPKPFSMFSVYVTEMSLSIADITLSTVRYYLFNRKRVLLKNQYSKSSAMFTPLAVYS